jgi:hypothetical protein
MKKAHPLRVSLVLSLLLVHVHAWVVVVLLWCLIAFIIRAWRWNAREGLPYRGKLHTHFTTCVVLRQVKQKGSLDRFVFTEKGYGRIERMCVFVCVCGLIIRLFYMGIGTPVVERKGCWVQAACFHLLALTESLKLYCVGGSGSQSFTQLFPLSSSSSLVHFLTCFPTLNPCTLPSSFQKAQGPFLLPLPPALIHYYYCYYYYYSLPSSNADRLDPIHIHKYIHTHSLCVLILPSFIICLFRSWNNQQKSTLFIHSLFPSTKFLYCIVSPRPSTERSNHCVIIVVSQSNPSTMTLWFHI